VIPASASSASKAAPVVLVTDDGLVAAGGDSGRDWGGGEDVVQGVAFVGFGAGQCPADGQTVQGAEQVQPQAPEEPGVGGAVAVLGPAGQLGAVHGFPGPGAFDRGGIDDPHVVAGDRGLPAEHPDQPGHGGRQFPQPLVVARLLGQVGEHLEQMSPGVAQPAGLAGVAQQSLHHRQREQFGIADLGGDADPRTGLEPLRVSSEQIIGGHIECGSEGVQIGVHRSSRIVLG
jgi:hypothetical protein